MADWGWGGGANVCVCVGGGGGGGGRGGEGVWCNEQWEHLGRLQRRACQRPMPRDWPTGSGWAFSRGTLLFDTTDCTVYTLPEPLLHGVSLRLTPELQVVTWPTSFHVVVRRAPLIPNVCRRNCRRSCGYQVNISGQVWHVADCAMSTPDRTHSKQTPTVTPRAAAPSPTARGWEHPMPGATRLQLVPEHLACW